MAESAEGIRTLVEASLATSGMDGLELWDVECAPGTVRVLVDRPGGIDLDALSAFGAKVISPLLDAHPELTPAGSYSLEVSSPGVERTLTRPEHFDRYLGSEVSVKTRVAVDGSRRWQGTLRSAGEGSIVIAPDRGPAEVTIDTVQIDRVRTVLAWGPAPKPGRPKSGSKSSTQVAKRPATDGRQAADPPVAFTEGTPE